MNIEKEKEYLIDLIYTITFDENRFKVMISNEKYLCGVVTSNICECNPLSKIAQYRTIYSTVFDLSIKIRWSLLEAISFAYSDSVIKQWGNLEPSGDEEDFAYYFIENAVYRIISLWDMLAQFYRIHYSVKVEKTKLYYKSFFEQKGKTNDEILTSEALNLKEIRCYINQTDLTDTEGEWKGNHAFVKKIRDMLVHRNEPNITTFSDFDVNIKHHPIYMLKRICEDYAVVSKFLNDIIVLSETEEFYELKDLLDN